MIQTNQSWIKQNTWLPIGDMSIYVYVWQQHYDVIEPVHYTVIYVMRAQLSLTNILLFL